MTTPADPPPESSEELAARLTSDLIVLDRELTEIDMLVGQTKAEATRHEQKRVQLAERLSAAGPTDPKELSDAYGQLVTQTRRAAVMEAQVEILEGKQRALLRHRNAIAAVAEAVSGMPAVAFVPPARPESLDDGIDDAQPGGRTPGLSRVVMTAQEDLRREIARQMHDGPAQSLTNIVLQTSIVERLMDRDPDSAKGELRLLVAMVQQTLDATKNFIFDVRPMVLDDLGVVPTLRRMARDRGRRAKIPVEFDSLGHDRRLPMEMESTVFRILDEALAAYLALAPDKVQLRLDWTEELEARLIAEKAPVLPDDDLPEVPTGNVPDALKQMIQERHDAHDAAVVAAKAAAIVELPAATRRDVAERAAAVGGRTEILGGGAELRLLVKLPPELPPDATDGAGDTSS
jgi:two-component system, NarL family, sensor histidine kinase DegS